MADNQMLLNRAKAAILARDYDLAVKLYKTLIQENPDDMNLKIQLGNLYVKSGKDDQALVVYKEILKIQQENIDVMLSMGGIYRRQKKYEESVAVLEQALTFGGNLAQVSYNLGFTFRQMGNYDDAINCFNDVVEVNPNDVLAYNHLGAIYALQGNHKKAISAYQSGLKVDPNHPVIQLNIGKSYEAVGDFQKALASYEGALRSKPGWLEAIDSYADLLLSVNKVKETEEVVSNALMLNPDDAKMHTKLGRVYNRQSIFDGAEAEFKKALTVDSEFAPALTGLAYSQEKQGKHDEAVETIEKVSELQPNDKEILKQSAHILLSASRTQQAYEKISKLWDENQNDVEILNLLGQYYILAGDERKVESVYEKIDRIKPGYLDLYKDWGERYVQKGDAKNAESYLKVAVAERPDDADSMIALANFYESQNRREDALDLFNKAGNADIFNSMAKKGSARLAGTVSPKEMLRRNIHEKNAAANIQNQAAGQDSSIDDSKFFDDVTSDDNVPVFTKDGLENLVDAIGINEDNEIPLMSEDNFMNTASDDLPLDSQSDSQSEDNILVESETEDNSFDFDQFGAENFSNTPDDDANVASVSEKLQDDDFLENSNDFERLVDDGLPIDEEAPEEVGRDAFMKIEEPEKIEKPVQAPVYVPAPPTEPVRVELSDKSLEEIEERIRQATEAAEKATFAAEKAWDAAQKAADSAQAAEALTYDDSFRDNEMEENIDKTLYPEIGEEDDLAAEDFDTDTEVSAADDNDDGNVNMEESEAAESMSDEDSLKMQRAIDMLPTIISAIEDRSMVYHFRSSLEMFKKLREMLDYLPPAQRKVFMTSRNRIMLDYIIAKLSGQPGLYATVKALQKSGLVRKNESPFVTEKIGLDLTVEVMENIREMSKNLEDGYLRDALDTEILNLMEKIQ